MITPKEKPVFETHAVDQNPNVIADSFSNEYTKKPMTALTRRKIEPDFTNREDLSSKNKTLYKRIFDLQIEAQWEQADSLIEELSDYRLLGYVLFQRYMHPTGYRSRYAELKDWLNIYSDHAGADEIYDLAMVRKAKSAKAPRKPNLKKGFPALDPDFLRKKSTYKSSKRKSHTNYKKGQEIKTAVKRDLSCCGAANACSKPFANKRGKKRLG